MKVEELIIDGFKSYATRTVISDWDPQFNAITGLNGSGKSNILDSICFVLGISSMATVRASNLQDLIYKRGQAGVTKASVTIVFDNSDKTNSPIGFETYPKISVTRQIVLGGTSKYLINGHRAQQQTVLHLFQSVQLNINNPNFLIMQGKITKVLNMKPSEILSLIEEAAGTKMFEDRREKAERTMAKKETKLQEITSLLQEEVEPKLQKLRNEKQIFLDFQETQVELEKMLRVVNAVTFSSLSDRKTNIETSLKRNHARSSELNSIIARLKEELATLKEDIEATRKQKQSELKKDGRLNQLESQDTHLTNECSRLSTTLGITEESLQEESAELQRFVDSVNQMRSLLNEKTNQVQKTQKDYEERNASLDELKGQLKAKDELLSTLTTGISSTGDANNGYEAQHSILTGKLNDIKVAIQSDEMKIDILTKELKANEPKLEQATEENKKLQRAIEAHKEKCSHFTKQLSELGLKPEILNELKREEHDLKNEIYSTSLEMDALQRTVANLDFSYSKPNSNFNPKSVKGVAAQLFTLKSEHMNSATALQVCAGGRLFNIVVDNEITASQLLEKGKLRKRVTIIPLNKISARRLQESTVAFAKKVAPNSVELALDLIGFEGEVTKAMEFIFGTSLICMDAEAAKKVTFHPQIRTRSITLQGDVYDPEGTLSGGSRNNSSSILLDIQKYNNVAQRKMKLELRLSEINRQLKEYEAILSRTKNLQNELSMEEHKQRMAERSLLNNESTEILQRHAEMKNEISQCEDGIKRNCINAESLELSVSNILRDKEEFSRDKGSKLEEINREIKDLTRRIEKEQDELEKQYDSYQGLQLEADQLNVDIASSEEKIKEVQKSLTSSEEKRAIESSLLSEAQHRLKQTREDLLEERSRIMVIDEELRELEKLNLDKKQILSESEMEFKHVTGELQKVRQNTTFIDDKLKELLEENDWLADDGIVSSIVKQQQNTDMEELRHRKENLEEKFQTLRRKVNPNIVSMIENVEKKESALRTMIATILKDKKKIQDTIFKLNDYKRETLIKTWEKVSADFGLIFGDLLPNSFAKLVPSEGKDITEGLEVKVRLGTMWKESLVELSGGQRSLIALSLILALLQFKPAPMYILDEVDAALDLSHTQNIGHLIKTRFNGSQFIVVSLKEGMFTNANRVFKTRFQDGTSVVNAL
ncbi:LAMI_0B04654g1_1 [Lachancea mirantina]|uniref:Structural maintenance of chromosomes protein n=1 Tax=Lachancea mirantina TaxID=1230905 RepID=A0A1G4IVM3_9SACH|nr:LAMI_0B04654g1_1 [Lachancea mirantina]